MLPPTRLLDGQDDAQAHRRKSLSVLVARLAARTGEKVGDGRPPGGALLSMLCVACALQPDDAYVLEPLAREMVLRNLGAGPEDRLAIRTPARTPR